ncbi:MAG: 5-(carboxyamino)imidazole ribonucleotide synthase, partial [Pyrinomonadaceae bacterium]
GYRVHTFSPGIDTPMGHISDVETTASYDDREAVRAFTKSVDVVTFEFENVPSATIDAAAEFVDVHPKAEVLKITQNRLREKCYLSANGFPVAPFRKIDTVEELFKAVEELGLPSILKTAGFGYDGKGQSKITSLGDIEPAFELLQRRPAVLEAFIEFEKEVSVVCARDASGGFVHYGVIENSHVNHILDISSAPADVSEIVLRHAVEIARSIADTMEYVGTLCVEFFLCEDEKLIVNELAPRPHNSGHLTFDACATSQFEQQVRAICGLPLGSAKFYGAAAMANLLGECWQNGEPDWAGALAAPNVKLHLYGKAEPRRGRKMGHLTAIGATTEEAVSAVINARDKLFR